MALVFRRAIACVCLLAVLGLGLGMARFAAAQEPRTDHPRLWLTADDLPRLRAWATDANPIWRDGLAPLAERMKADMDEGRVPGEDTVSRGWTGYPTESYAELFAFLSQVHPDEAARLDYADRARTLLMYAMNEAVQGPDASVGGFRDPELMIPHSDRARWWGEAWGLTVDWIYPSLSPEDKATIRTVFLRWADEMVTQGYNHPEPVGLVNDPALLADRALLRWAGNNYFTSHMRNVGLMALALDPEDDPGGELAAYLEIATGAYLYMADALLRTDAAGGIAPEGFEYSPQAVGYVAQFLLALETAGLADPARFGPQVVLDDNPFFDQIVPAHLHSMSPRTTIVEGMESFGQVYLPNWFGDGELYFAPDMIWLLGPLGLHDRINGNTDRLDQIRWVETHLSPGGEELLAIDRVYYANGSALLTAILYFMLFDPELPPPADPYDDQLSMHFAPGIGRLMARTGWDEDAEYFTYGLGWVTIDHQFGDGNTFSYYRNGEWLTKNLVGYGGEYGDEDPSDDFYYPSSDHQNTLALENDEPYSNVPTDYRSELYRRGSQWEYVAVGDPTILAMSVQPGFAYAMGDATNLYNSEQEGSMDILHASRSIVWLAPDAIVVYDRAASKTDGRFKRFWLNLLAEATVDGMRTTMPTESGQQLVIDTLLPADATPVVEPQDGPIDTLAIGEPMRFRFMVEAPGGPAETRFLNVLQGADAGKAAVEPAAVASEDGAFAGAVVGTTVVLFPVEVGVVPEAIRYVVPETTAAHLITGLAPDAGFDVAVEPADGGIAVTLAPGDSYRSDAGGVLLAGELPTVIPRGTLTFTSEGSGSTTPIDPLAAAPSEPATQVAESPSAADGAAIHPEAVLDELMATLPGDPGGAGDFDPQAALDGVTEALPDDVAGAVSDQVPETAFEDVTGALTGEEGSGDVFGAAEDIVGGAADVFDVPIEEAPLELAAADAEAPADADVPAGPVEGGAAASGSGRIVYEVFDTERLETRLFRLAAAEGETAEDVSAALDAQGTALDEWIKASSDGAWLLLGSQRFDEACAGWPCLAVVPADLSSGAAVRTAVDVVHADGIGAIAGGGQLIVYPAGGGPNERDLWAIRRQGDVWSEPLLLSGKSPYAYNDAPALNADGSRVAFDCGDQPYGQEGTAICEAATDAAEFRVVLTPQEAPEGIAPDGAHSSPAYAPDGSIVFQSRWTDGLWRIGADAVPEPIGAFTSDMAPCMLPDGRIASLWMGRDGSAGLSELKVMTPDGSSYVMLLTGVQVESMGCGG